jgi:hypothetical protein
VRLGGAAASGKSGPVAVDGGALSSGVPSSHGGYGSAGLMAPMAPMAPVVPVAPMAQEGSGPIGGTRPGAEVPGGESLMGAAAAAMGTGVVQRPGWAVKMGLTELMDQRRGLMLVAALSAVVVVLSLWLGLRGELRARRAAREGVAMEPAAPLAGSGAAQAGEAGSAAAGLEGRLDHRAATMQGDAGAAQGVQADAMTAAGPAADGGAGRIGAAGDVVGTRPVGEPGSAAAGEPGSAPAGEPEIELEPELLDEPEARATAPGRGSRAGRQGRSKGGSSDRTVGRGDQGGASAAATGAASTASPGSTAPGATEAIGAARPVAEPPPAASPAPSRPSPPPTSGPIAATVPAVTPPVLPRTPRVPTGMLGDEERGAAVLARCNACHAQSKARRVEGKQMTRSQWERFFRNGNHDRNLPLGAQLSQKEMADAKAFLMTRALDGLFDQGAGVR